MYVSHAVPPEAEEALRAPAAASTDSTKLPCGCWNLNSDPLVKQPVHLTAELTYLTSPAAVFKSITRSCQHLILFLSLLISHGN